MLWHNNSFILKEMDDIISTFASKSGPWLESSSTLVEFFNIIFAYTKLENSNNYRINRATKCLLSVS